MSRDEEKGWSVSGLFLVGICLCGVAFLSPVAGQNHGESFIKIARSSSWHRLLELAAAWCSLRIILASIGLFLMIDCLGTVLVRRNHKDLAVAVFCLNIVSCLGCLTGCYYLIKALL